MPGRYPYNDRKETDDSTDASPFLHRCDYAGCRAPATNLFRDGTRLCMKHGSDYKRLGQPKR